MNKTPDRHSHLKTRVGHTFYRNCPVAVVDLEQLAKNFRTLSSMVENTVEVASVVKADAYGLGIERCSRALLSSGCKTFFVNTVEEAKKIRESCGSAPNIFALEGARDQAAKDEARANDVEPLINEIRELEDFDFNEMRRQKFSIRVDLGLNRLGIPVKSLSDYLEKVVKFKGSPYFFLVGHLSNAYNPHDESNVEQKKAFADLVEKFRSKGAKIRSSLAGSSGTYLGKDYHFDMVRVGSALYGGRPSRNSDPLPTPIRVLAPIICTRSAFTGDTVGYGSNTRLLNPTNLAIVALGYSDGFTDRLMKLNLKIDEHVVSVVGTPSMNYVTVDVTKVDESCFVQDRMIEVISPCLSVSGQADLADLSTPELLCTFVKNLRKEYVEGSSPNFL